MSVESLGESHEITIIDRSNRCKRCTPAVGLGNGYCAEETARELVHRHKLAVQPEWEEQRARWTPPLALWSPRPPVQQQLHRSSSRFGRRKLPRL